MRKVLLAVILGITFPSVAAAIPTTHQIRLARRAASAEILALVPTLGEAKLCDAETQERAERTQNGTATDHDARCNRVVEIGAALGSLMSGGTCPFCDATIAWCIAAEIVEGAHDYFAEYELWYRDKAYAAEYEYYSNQAIWASLPPSTQQAIVIGIIYWHL